MKISIKCKNATASQEVAEAGHRASARFSSAVYTWFSVMVKKEVGGVVSKRVIVVGKGLVREGLWWGSEVVRKR